RAHLYFVAEPIREQRADGAVDQARDQGFLLGRAAFALEEAARDAPAGIELLLVIDGQREEVLPFTRGPVGDRGDQQHGAVAGHHDRAAGLACDLAGLERDRPIAVLEALGNFRHVGFLETLAMNRTWPLPGAGGRDCSGSGMVKRKAKPRRIAAPRRGSGLPAQAELLDQLAVAR